MRICASLSAVLVLCVAHACWAAQYQQILAANPAHPGKCFEPVLKVAFAVNTSITDHEACTTISCHKGEDGGFLAIGSTCAIPREWPENCVLTTPNLELDYPFCCQQLECDGEPEGSYSAVGK